ncbi:MAG TPA: metal-dependent transcriptional regulator [Gemmatimonadales bacterium]|nr:metal-dependent transcriptional regulator [Gemmatimonadales bacterium]
MPKSREVPAVGPLTRSVEDYLKAIYRLTLPGGSASTTALATHLGLTAASVTGMIKRLAGQGYLRHEPYRGVSLTPHGRRAALRTLRNHRILEAYLVGFLGFDWDDVHVEAERLEHAVSPELIERMARALGNPSVDPHGDPIPGPDGSVVEVEYTPLPDVPIGAMAEVRRVDSTDAERLRYLAAMGLKPGATVIVTARQPFDGPLTVRTPGGVQVLGHDVGALVYCLPPAGARR